MDDLSSLPQADQDAIGMTLTSLLAGFRSAMWTSWQACTAPTPTGSTHSGVSNTVQMRSLRISGACLQMPTSTQER